MFPIALPNGCRKAEKAVSLCLLVFQRAFLNRTGCRNTTASQKHRRINLPGITIGMRRANLYRALKLIADLRPSCNFFCRLATCIKIDTACGFLLFPCCFDRLSRKRETQLRLPFGILCNTRLFRQMPCYMNAFLGIVRDIVCGKFICCCKSKAAKYKKEQRDRHKSPSATLIDREDRYYKGNAQRSKQHRMHHGKAAPCKYAEG